MAVDWFGGYAPVNFTYTTAVSGYQGLESISLGELLGNPTQAFPQLQSNLMNNWQGILVGSFVTAAGFKVLKKVLRRPISRVNTGLFGKRGIIGPIGFKL